MLIQQKKDHNLNRNIYELFKVEFEVEIKSVKLII